MPPSAISKRPLRFCARVGEGAAHVAEHLALEQRRRDPAEVDLDERRAAGAAVPVHRLGDQLLAGAALAGDQHRCVGGRDAADELEDAEQLRVAAEDLSEVEALVELSPCHLGRLGGPGLADAEGRLDGADDVRVRPWLGDEVGRSPLHPFDSQRDRPPGRNQNHRQPRIFAPQSREKLQSLFSTRTPGEVHILNDELRTFAAKPREGLGGCASRLGAVASLLEKKRKRRGDRGVIIDDENHVSRSATTLRCVL